MAKTKRSDRRGLGSAVRTHIYKYGKKGKLEGFQARLKRASPKGKPESTSAYFSFANYGTQAAALAAADRWLRKNAQWQRNRRFKPRPRARRGAGTGYLKLVKVRTARPARKHARAA